MTSLTAVADNGTAPSSQLQMLIAAIMGEPPAADPRVVEWLSFYLYCCHCGKRLDDFETGTLCDGCADAVAA